MHKKLVLIVCLIILIALALPAEGRRRKEKENGEAKTEGTASIMYNKHEKLDKHNKHNKHGKGEHQKGERHHWSEHGRFRLSQNLSIHFVEESLSPSVYLLLEDNGIQVKAAYERLGNSTALTKVGIKVSGKSIIVSANGNLAVDGQGHLFSEFESIEFEKGKLIRKHNSLILKFGVYRIFLKMHHAREHSIEELNEVPRIRVVVGVKKNAQVHPSGFIGDRISLDPAKYITPGTIS